ncbi:MAG: hypothetical protein K5985_12075 [Lachnospiraceae bacterium]|nr:hypothetical protein [Lachnospiraceae bacterium]
MEVWGLNLTRAVGEGILMALLLGLVSKRAPRFREALMGIFIPLQILSVVLLYSAQEESALFFFHPFLSWLIMDLSDLAVYRRGSVGVKTAVFEKLLLWPFAVIPVVSGFILTLGWLIKLYVVKGILY